MSDLHDDELRDVLWHASGDDTDTGDALLRVEARVRRIRRRRMDIAGVGLLVALVVTLGIASRSRTHETPNRPASFVTVAPPISGPARTTPASSAPPDTTPAPSGNTESAIPVAPVTEAPPVVETAAPDTAAVEVTADDSAASAAEPAPEPEQHDTPPATPAPSSNGHGNRVQQTFTASGGQLTVSVRNGALAVVSATPGPGYIAGHPMTTGSTAEVEFRSRRGKSRIRVDLVDGHLQPTIANEDYTGSGDADGNRRTSTTTTPSNTDDSSQRGDGSRSGRQRTDATTATQHG